MSRRALSLFSLGAALIGLAFLAPLAAATQVRILGPRVDSFIQAAPVRVTLKTSKSVGRVEATLDHKRVDRSFKRVGAGRWSADLGAGQLVAGTNRLVVSVRSSGGGRRYASTRFVVGRRVRSLLTVVGPRRGNGVVARVRVASRPQKLDAKLNGRRLRWPLGLVPGRQELLRLGGDDGLHFGVNHLRVRAIGVGGAYDVESRKVVVPRDAPLAGAGSDRKVAAGHAIRLDGRSSRAASGSPARLGYRWRIVARPPGSKARLRDVDSARPLLKTDRPGAYRVSLVVTEPGPGGPRSAADVAAITSVPDLPPIGEPIETMASNNKTGAEADSGIRIGETTYWMGAPQGKTAQVLLLDRESLQVLYSASYSSEAEVKKFGEELEKYGSNALAIISVPNVHGNAPRDVALGLLAANIGAENGGLYESWRAGWSAIGVFKTEQGGTIALGSNPNPENGAEYAGRLSGYLQQSSGGGFVFVPGGRVPFETDAPGGPGGQNSIAVGSVKYGSEEMPTCVAGGFQIQVVQAETLAPAGGATFATNGCGAEEEGAQQHRMANFLYGIKEGPKLVFVQSIGSPYGAGGGAWGALTGAIEAVGGTGPVFAEARSSYALVGAVGISPLPPAEASETLTGTPARISGVLAPDQVSAYAPELASPTAATTYPIATIAYQSPQEWPDSQSAGDRAALAWVAEHVLRLEAPSLDSACYVPATPDVRSEYCNLQYRNKWSSYATRVLQAKFEPGHGFGAAEWEAVTKELGEEEFETVQSVWTFIDHLQEVLGTSVEPGQVDLGHIATEIEKAVTPPPKSEALGWWLELLGNLASTGSYFGIGETEPELVQKAMGIFQGAMFEVSSSLYETGGEPVLARFKLRAEDLALDFSTRFLKDSEKLGSLGEILVSDYGKLRAIGKSGLLGFNAKSSTAAIEAIGRGTEMWAYENLLPVGYEAIRLEQGGLNGPLKNASEFLCVASSGPRTPGVSYHPFAEIPAAEYKIASPSESFGVLVRSGSSLPENGQPMVEPARPPESLLKNLTEPKSGPVAYFAPWFWQRAYEFPSKKTRSVTC